MKYTFYEQSFKSLKSILFYMCKISNGNYKLITLIILVILL